jgi:RNA polymerase sigma-70 factor, ECF subfamily
MGATMIAALVATQIATLDANQDATQDAIQGSTRPAIRDHADCQSLPVWELLRACTDDSSDHAWTEFIQRFHRLITGVVSRLCREWAGTSPDVVEDLIQETYLKLCANNYSLLVNFHSQHPYAFLGYIKTVTTNVVYDYLRSAHASKRDVGRNVELDQTLDYLVASHGEAESLEKTVLLREIDHLLLQRGDGPSEQNERAIFWLYYRDGLTAKEIASRPGTRSTIKRVEGIIARLTKLVRKSVAFRTSGLLVIPNTLRAGQAA